MKLNKDHYLRKADGVTAICNLDGSVVGWFDNDPFIGTDLEREFSNEQAWWWTPPDSSLLGFRPATVEELEKRGFDPIWIDNYRRYEAKFRHSGSTGDDAIALIRGKYYRVHFNWRLGNRVCVYVGDIECFVNIDEIWMIHEFLTLVTPFDGVYVVVGYDTKGEEFVLAPFDHISKYQTALK